MTVTTEAVEPGGPRARRPRILYLAHRLPYPPDKGDRIRTYHVLKSVSRLASVHLACLADEPVDDASLAALRGLCERIEVIELGPVARKARIALSLARGRTASEGAFDSPALRAVLRRWSGETRFDAALASASSLVPYLRMPGLRDTPAVVDVVDVDSQKWLEYADSHRGPKRWLYGLEGRRLRRLERDLCGWARAVTLVSEAEADLFRTACGDGPVYGITNGVDLDTFRPQPTVKEDGCVFVGALDYTPNVQGVDWFCRAVWPEVRRRVPTAVFRLVGRRPVPEVCRLAGLPGVELVGQVPDVRPYVAGAAVVVAPLQIARGVQNKVLEALAMGKAVVASPQALTGLRAEPGAHVESAGTPGEWADAVVRLLSDASLRRRLGDAGRRHVEEHHRWDDCLDGLGPLLGLDEGPGLDRIKSHDPSHARPAGGSTPTAEFPVPPQPVS